MALPSGRLARCAIDHTPGGWPMPYVVMVAMTVDEDDPDRAAEFVRAELRSKLGVDDPVLRADKPAPLPRWRVTARGRGRVRRPWARSAAGRGVIPGSIAMRRQWGRPRRAGDGGGG